ncbi:MAG: hypothetical protein SVO26_01935 [Chloroflexota bacterium]|nr:hypothetical protein [Chloroflexota bacterium]
MSTVVTKLFRDPEEAKIALGELKTKGYKPEEIGVLSSAERAKEMGDDVKSTSDAQKLAEMGVPQTTVDYYQYAIESGGIVVSVQTDEGRKSQVQELLRTVPMCGCETRICGASPGFKVAGRMSATNPVDAPMSGDFRRY